MKNIDSVGHVRGESIYLDDIPLQMGTLFGAVLSSPVAHGKITLLDTSAALATPGVVAVLTHESITGENQIGGIFPDEPLLAEKEVHFSGQPIAFVIAKSEQLAQKVRKLIRLEIDELPPITDPRKAKEAGELIMPPRTFALGNTEDAFSQCTHVFEGRADVNGQEHLYIETQGAYAVPMENGRLRLYSSTQGPTAVQRTTAKVLGIPMRQIEVDVTRLGGGFGGKEDQATAWGVMAALGAFLLKKPVKYSMHRMDDLKMTGKRHPYSCDYKIGLSEDLKIMAYEVEFYQNAGAAADLSPAVMERTLFHATNAYFVPNVRATAYSCKTNLPPNTAFRGFGGPQGMFVIEAAIAHAAHKLKTTADVIQEKNLLQDNDEFPYGQIAAGTGGKTSWQEAMTKFDFEKKKQAVADFNAQNHQQKKGWAIMPICFGISFTKTGLNQARALVHVYSDGSVGISTGAVEMGQGVNTKMLQVAAQSFSIQPNRVQIETTNTTRVANTSPSAASATADLNGKAVEIACAAILSRLKEFAAQELGTEASEIEIRDEKVYKSGQETDLGWNKLIDSAYWNRISLSEHAHYSTPEVHFDPQKEKGHPFAYHVYGTAIFTVTVDALRGTYEFDEVEIVHDFGKSMNIPVDHGQIEGGLVQGIGWMTMEELYYDDKGLLRSNALSTYKIPDIYSVPKEIKIEHMTTEGHERAIKKSKAVGEPPLLYGIGAYFAIQNAVRNFTGYEQTLSFDAPYTPERVLCDLYAKNAGKISS